MSGQFQSSLQIWPLLKQIEFLSAQNAPFGRRGPLYAIWNFTPIFIFSTLRNFYVKMATSEREGGGLHILSWETTKVWYGKGWTKLRYDKGWIHSDITTWGGGGGVGCYTAVRHCITGSLRVIGSECNYNPVDAWTNCKNGQWWLVYIRPGVFACVYTNELRVYIQSNN